MNIPDAFVLYRSSRVTVRVEPPDVAVVERLGTNVLRLRRSEVRGSAAMQVRYYRKRHDRSFVAPNDEDIVVRLELSGGPDQVLGPFEHKEGIAVAEALDLARRRMLYAVPGFSASISADGASLVIARSGMTVPIPVARLTAMTVRDDDRIQAKHRIPTWCAADAHSRWVELAFHRGLPWLLGPIGAADAATLAAGFGRWRAEHPLDFVPTVVDPKELLADPTRWHLRLIDVTAIWHYAFECSQFLRVWLEAPAHAPVSFGVYRARVVGTWIHPIATAEGGYGHMGGSPGELLADSIEIVEVLRTTQSTTDGLTGLLRRSALGAAFAQERSQDPSRNVGFALLNIDRFKRINDTHGHVLGDEVLRRAAATVVAALRPGDLVARWSGDEMAIVLPGATLETAREVVERTLVQVRDLVLDAGEHEVRMTMSAGVVEVGPGEALGEATERAVNALYEAKRAGRDRIVTDPR